MPGKPINKICGCGMWRKVGTVQSVYDTDIASFEASADKKHRLIKIPRHAFSRNTLPRTSKFDGGSEHKCFVLFKTPSTIFKITRRYSCAPQEFLNLISGYLCGFIENPEELTCE